ncbi:MAG: transcriptional activator NhaR [Sandaracinaceae bacterium]|nr:MAG: transcriptional activator NhaR [Sandaracinaceae bacterium]
MEWLNYHHLLYFWMVAKEGSVTAAAESLRLSQPTVSAQVKRLEEQLGEPLLRRAGRSLELTEMGKVAFRYANDIFTLGQEMQDVFAGRLERAPEKLTVGVSDLIPKLILHRLLEPALSHESAPRIVCREDKTERLLAELSIHDLDIVLAEAPIARQASVRAFNHLLGESDVSFFAKAPMARRYRSGFPHSLDAAPLLLPTENTLLRRDLDHWFQDEDIHPRIVAEFEDSALLKAFGSEGVGIFPGPAAIEDEICDRYRVRPVGRTHRVVERFYAITVERRITHPAARLISEAAKTRLFPT